MKKIFVSMCVAFAMFAMVSCGNPAISAAEDFIANPCEETAKACEEAEKNLDADEKKEYEEWSKEHATELAAALVKYVGDELAE